MRKVIIESLKLLQTHSWDSSLIQKFVKVVDDVLKLDSAPGFVTHLLNVIKDELRNLLQEQARSCFLLFTAITKLIKTTLISCKLLYVPVYS